MPAQDELGRTVVRPIAAERSLTLRLDGHELATLTTLGTAPAYLALGYLRNARIVERIADIASVDVDWETASVAVTTRGPTERGVPRRNADRGDAQGTATAPLTHRTIATDEATGSVSASTAADPDSVRLPSHARLTEETLYAVLEHVRRRESIYAASGAVHGCALCSNAGDNRGEILGLVEDVGPHNAVDAIAGWMWWEGLDGSNTLLYTTGHLCADAVMKCAQMGVPFLISRSDPTQAGWELARGLDMTMLGRCDGRHYLLFTGQERFLRPQQTAFA